MQNKNTFAFFVLLSLCFGLIIFSLFIGKYSLSASEYLSYFNALIKGDVSRHLDIHTVFFELRFPRVLACVIIGAALSISGSAYQAMFVNPLVSPSILGVLSGAGFGAALGMFFGLTPFYVGLSTFVFGIVAVCVSLGFVIVFNSGRGIILLVLGGIISSSFFTSLLSILKYAADPNDTLPNITYFLMGSLSFASAKAVFLATLPMLFGIVMLCFCFKGLNALSLGEEEAKSLGIDAMRFKIFVIILATFISALSVSMAGVIGWIGLIVPHITRFLFSSDNKIVLPFSALIGAMFLLVCDDLSRILFEYEIPIGIITSLIGIPVFVAILFRVKGGFGAN